MATRNLGQVAGLWIGTNPPANTDLIWLDTSLNPAVHKVYANGGWNNLAQNIISTIGYANLKNLAQTTGLTLGSWYKITDNSVAYRNNVLAYALTSQRIHYVANNGNIVIDDLSSSSLAEFRVPCINNLLIDGITGDWSNNQLNFNFNEATPSNAADYFLFGKRLVNSVYQFAKFKISGFISSVTGNDLQWNNGLYINLNTLLNNRYDQVGGVTAYNTYAAKIALVDASLQTLSENYQHLISGYTDSNNVVHSDGIIDEKIADATSNAAIIGDGTNANPGKALPSINTSLTSGMNDINAGDTLRNIISKCQGWFNNLKLATNVLLTNTYTAATNNGFPAVGDSVQLAIQKIGYWLNNVTKHIFPTDFTPASKTITPGTSTVQDWMEDSDYELRRKRQYDLVIKPDSSLPYYGLKQLEGVAATVKSVLIKAGTYSVVYTNSTGLILDLINVTNLLQNDAVIDFEPGVVIECSNNYSMAFQENKPAYSLFYASASVRDASKSRWNCNNALFKNLGFSGSQSPYELRIFKYCNNINDVVMFNPYNGLTEDNFPYNPVLSLFNCNNVNNVSGLLYGCRYVNNSRGYFWACNLCNNCTGWFKLSRFLNTCHCGDSERFIDCERISTCTGKFYGCHYLNTCEGTFNACLGMLLNTGFMGNPTNCKVEITGTTAVSGTVSGGLNENWDIE